MIAAMRMHSDRLCEIRADLMRPHPHAWERVGFITAAVTASGGGLLLLARGYMTVADEDYLHDSGVGASIGSDAFRKALQCAYREKSTLLHVHAHHGIGRPEFSGVDLSSGSTFAPSFFTTVPRMPHGMIVLSGDGAYGLLWLAEDCAPVPIENFSQIGTHYRRDWNPT